MKNSFFGWLAAILGWLGVVLCVAAIVFGWILSSRIHEAIDRSEEVLTGVTTSTSTRTRELRGRVTGLQQRVTEMQAGVDAAVEERIGDPEALRELVHRLRGQVIELREWVALASTTREFVGVVGELLESFQSISGSEGDDEMKQALAEGGDQLEATASSLDSLLQAMEAVGDREPLAAHRPLLERCGKLLGTVDSGLGDFEYRVEEAETAIENFSQDLHFKLRLITGAAFAFFLWQAWAQLSLARWGGCNLKG